MKFTLRGGAVSLHIEHSEQGVALVATDTGMAEALQALCQPFRQADSLIGCKFDGSGLALALSRSLLTLHDGALIMESAPHVGTTVRARFPADRIIETMVASRAAT